MFTFAILLRGILSTFSFYIMSGKKVYYSLYDVSVLAQSRMTVIAEQEAETSNMYSGLNNENPIIIVAAFAQTQVMI